MFDDPWPEEPDDPYGDPTEQFDLEIPEPDDVPKDLWRAFWGLVAVFNIALFALALGPMLMVFRSQYLYGGVITSIGVVTLLYGLHRYRMYRARQGS